MFPIIAALLFLNLRNPQVPRPDFQGPQRQIFVAGVALLGRGVVEYIKSHRPSLSVEEVA